MSIPSPNNVSALKQLEKKNTKQDAAVSHQLKDLTMLEMASNKAAKVCAVRVPSIVYAHLIQGS